MKDATLVTTLGRAPHDHHGIVNPPIYRASTILSPTLEAYETKKPGAGSYGRYGTPTTFELQAAVAALEGADGAIAVGSGKTAIAGTLLAMLAAGDHIVITDGAYGPTRRFAEGMLRRYGVESSFCPPRIGRGIADLLRPDTRLVFLESPSSLSFEIQDVPAIVEVAHRAGALVAIDNTWASPLYCKPFQLGVDISIHAATKYIGGHSDLMMGIVTAKEPLLARLQKGLFELATAAAPEECYLALRGLRTLAVRLARHWESGLELARWLQTRPEVAEVWHPGLPDSPDHALWRRDFQGASGLFGFLLRPCPKAAQAALMDGLELFGMGASWGGYESLLIPTDPANLRTAEPWAKEGRPMRIHVGLEDPGDLIRDLEAGFARLRAAA